jgi:signal transduction histidine kinase
MEDGSWHAAPTVWAFSIRPTIVQTRWFYAVCALALALAVWGAWLFRVGLVRRQYAMVLSERARMSREIHDTLLQSFVGLAMHLDALADSLEGVSRSAQQTALRMRRQVEASIREARQSIWNLRSPVLETHDLPGALRKAAEDVTGGTPIRVVLTTNGELRRLPGRLENELLRSAQEAVTKTVRHAQASRIDIELGFAADSVALRISDDGRGLGDKATLDRDSHFGIVSMKERAESLGGRFTVGSPAGGGTRVEAVLPLTVAA